MRTAPVPGLGFSVYPTRSGWVRACTVAGCEAYMGRYPSRDAAVKAARNHLEIRHPFHLPTRRFPNSSTTTRKEYPQ